MSTAHKLDSEYMPEHFDKERTLDESCKLLAQWIKESKYFIAFTGAGISTSCGIPDFRGPGGCWTLRAKGIKRKKKTTSVHRAVPSKCHMSLVKLMDDGILKYVISQNCDGLHIRSGIDRRKISELHGNTNLERCTSKKCGKEYLRDFRTRKYPPGSANRDHVTLRKCSVCNGPLVDTLVAFGENLQPKVLNRAYDNGKKADLCVVFGSSLTVYPAADIPEDLAKRGKRLVIVNLQKTPLHNVSSLNIHGKTDLVMSKVMNYLGYQNIPKWKLRRKLLIRWKNRKNRPIKNYSLQKMFILGLDYVDLTFFEFIKTVEISAGPRPRSIKTKTKSKTKSKKKPIISKQKQRIKSMKAPHAIPVSRNSNNFRIKLDFFKHYKEPSLILDVKRPEDKDYIIFNLQYDVFTRKWDVEIDNSKREEIDRGFQKFMKNLE